MNLLILNTRIYTLTFSNPICLQSLEVISDLSSKGTSLLTDGSSQKEQAQIASPGRISGHGYATFKQTPEYVKECPKFSLQRCMNP